MKKLLLLCFTIVSMIFNAQINLGNGTTTGLYPVEVYYGYTYSQQIFTKSEINASAAGNITGLKFYLGSAANLDVSNDWTVYMAHTTKTAFDSNTDWIPTTTTGWTQVFSGTVVNNNGIVEITFPTSFNYNNTDNLVIAVDENLASYNGTADRFYNFTGAANSSIIFYSDGTNPDPTAPPTGTRSNSKSVVTLLGLAPNLPTCASSLVPAANATNVAKNTTLDWAAVTAASSYDVYFGTTANPPLVGNVTTNSYTPNPILNANTTYYWKVIPKNSVGEATGCLEQSFTTGTIINPCTPTYTYGIQYGDLISNVVISNTTLSNNSGTAVDPNVSYTYFTGQPNYTAQLQAGNTYNVTVTVGSFGSQNVAVWIDYNDNGTFETTERVGYTTTSISGNGTATFPITLACNPPLGTHRMRVRDVYSTAGNTIDPCTNYSYGETEDYDVTVTQAVACPAPSAGTSSAVTTTTATLAWTIGCTETAWDVHIVTAGSPAPTSTTTASHPNATPNTGFNVTSLTPSTTYEWYVKANCGGTNGSSTWAGPYTFTTAALPPANDDCSGAVNLTVNPDLACGTTAAGTTNGATASTDAAPTCGATGTNDDVWYKFTATNTTHTVSLNNVSNFTDMAMALYSGTCGSLIEVACSDPNTATVSGLTVGDVYYVRVWTYNAGTAITATFNICVGTPPPPPANDNCSGAVSLTPGGTFNQNAVTGTTSSATAGTPANPPCGGTTSTSINVWYSVVVPASGNITIETDAVTGSLLTDTVISVYSGTDCSSLTEVSGGCDDDTGNLSFSKVSLTGQTPGSTLYISVWRYGSQSDGDFRVSAYDASLSTTELNVKDNDIYVYPNPFTDVIYITDARNVKAITVVDASGRMVKKIANPTPEVNLGDLKSGLYIIKIDKVDGSSTSEKVIKK